MSSITGIDLPVPIQWSSVSAEANDHLGHLDQLMTQTVSYEGRTVTYNELFQLALATDFLEAIFYPRRRAIGVFLIQHFLPTSSADIQACKRLFIDWLTFTPPPDPIDAPQALNPQNGGPGFYIECWDYIVNTIPGLVLANQNDFKAWFTKFLNYHGDWINSTDSAITLSSWKTYPGTTEHPFKISWYQQPDPSSPSGGFKSFNQFFLRNLEPGLRPLCDDPKAIVAPCDGGVFYLYKEGQEGGPQRKFTLPGKSDDPFDLVDAIPGYGEDFVGGPLLDILLWFTDYHHFHAPVAGKVIDQVHYPGSYNYDFDDFNPFHPGKLPSEDSDRVGWYQGLAKHQRFVWVIETEDVGNVAMIAIGFWGVGSITNAVNVGDTIEKGQYMGHFDYGGSSIVLAFEPGHNLEFAVDGKPVSDADHPEQMNVRACLGKVAK